MPLLFIGLTPNGTAFTQIVAEVHPECQEEVYDYRRSDSEERNVAKIHPHASVADAYFVPEITTDAKCRTFDQIFEWIFHGMI